ncbi:spore germination protein [Paenibacillus sp. PL2-23]|uniref:spore germination protein n=1 Tax=Paenibacillus sp. PL2-23 TaxID=2100729 RepID=UPI0030F5A12D
MISKPGTANNYEQLGKQLHNSSDFKSRLLHAGEHRYRLFYMDSMIDPKIVQDHIIQPLLQQPGVPVGEAVTILNYAETDWLPEAAKAIIEGKSVLQREGDATLYLLDTPLNKERSINIPVNERALRGSNEALIENLQTNVYMLRQMMATSDLAVKSYTLGKRTNTTVSILYMDSLVNKDVLREFEKRIQQIELDYVEAPGFVRELIQDKQFAMFPRFLVTERPDRVRSYLMDGKIAIITEGSPDCLILPVTFWAFFQSPDDYQLGWMFGSAVRLLRIFCFLIAISLPGAYVALVTFDPRMLPFEIALTLQSSLQYIAMSPLLEAVFMLLTLEILREASIRLPNPIGQTLGVVGGIVIGTIVVQSNLISNMMVIVIAVTGISSFIIPTYEMSGAARYLTYPFIVLSALFGLIGLVLAYMLLITHLSRLHTMGIPYFISSVGPRRSWDTVFRAPIRLLKQRKNSKSDLG